MLIRIKNRLLEGGEVAMEIPSSSPECRNWLAIYPIRATNLDNYPGLLKEIDISSRRTDVDFAFRILQFKVPTIYLENEWDISEEELQDKTGKVVFGYAELMNELEKQGINTNSLLEPWKTDFPL